MNKLHFFNLFTARHKMHLLIIANFWAFLQTKRTDFPTLSYTSTSEILTLSGAPNDNFRKNICSEDDLRSRIFEIFVVKFLACLPLLGFSNISKMV